MGFAHFLKNHTFSFLVKSNLVKLEGTMFLPPMVSVLCLNGRNLTCQVGLYFDVWPTIRQVTRRTGIWTLWSYLFCPLFRTEILFNECPLFFPDFVPRRLLLHVENKLHHAGLLHLRPHPHLQGGGQVADPILNQLKIKVSI